VCALQVRYSAETTEFQFLDGEGNATGQSVAYGYHWTPIPSSEAIFLQLWSSVLPESQVIRLVTTEDKTAGWLCTVSALTSNAHQYFESVFFRAAAGHAMQLLLEDDAVQKVLSKRDSPSIDVFPSGACVLIAKRDLIPNEISSAPERLLPLLHRHTFSPYKFGKEKQRTAGKFATANLTTDGQGIKKLKLKLISDEVPFPDFVNTVLSEPLSQEQDPAYTFFLYYQIIELLMEEVQKYKTLKFAADLQNSANDTTKLYELTQELKDHTSELGRIVSLVHSFTKVPAEELEGLKTECLNLLRKLDRIGKISECGHSLYAVRNMLVHNMRRLSAEALTVMPLINEYLEVVVPHMLLTFENSKPTPDTTQTLQPV
jgi:hypothetical protein